MAVMLQTVPQINVLNLLFEQYRLYTTDLGRTHEGLGKLYKKLTKLDRKLSEQCDHPLSREQRRKLSWSRTTAKQSIGDLLARQAEIFALLQQCRDLISSYNLSGYATPTTPWTAYLPPTPFSMHGVSAYPPTPWTAGPYRQSITSPPQYWDLSMLYDRGALSPTHSNSTSSKQDLAIDVQHTAVGDEQFPHHTYCHELMGSVPPVQEENAIADDDLLRAGLEGANARSATRAASFITVDTEKANEMHKRRYSEHFGEKTLHLHGHSDAHEPSPRSLSRIDFIRAKTVPELQVQSHV